MDGDKAMKNVLEKHEVKLTVRGPVFVGDGKEIDKKEYLFLGGKKVGVVDFARLYGLAKSRGKEKALEKYMLEEYTYLEAWLKREGLYDEAVKKSLRYTISMGDNQLTRGTKTQIMSCIKDGEGSPYLPGSSIKGMLRTILGYEGLKEAPDKGRLASQIQKGAEHAVSQGKVNRKNFLSKETKELEISLFRNLNRPTTKPRDAVNDVLSGLIVGDSEPVPLSQLVLAQKVERNVYGEEKTLNLLREAFMPGTEICFPLTIDRSICSWDKDYIEKAIADFSKLYNECFISAFKDAVPLKANQVLLGGGTGYVSKTLVYPLLGKKAGVESAARIIDATLPYKIRSKHKHNQDVRLGVSPHILKCTWFGGRTVQMGLCDIEIR